MPNEHQDQWVNIPLQNRGDSALHILPSYSEIIPQSDLPPPGYRKCLSNCSVRAVISLLVGIGVFIGLTLVRSYYGWGPQEPCIAKVHGILYETPTVWMQQARTKHYDVCYQNLDACNPSDAACVELSCTKSDELTSKALDEMGNPWDHTCSAKLIQERLKQTGEAREDGIMYPHPCVVAGARELIAAGIRQRDQITMWVFGTGIAIVVGVVLWCILTMIANGWMMRN